MKSVLDSPDVLAQPQPQPNPSFKLFPERDFIGGAIVGGPIAPIYFFYKNFKVQGNGRAAKLSILWGVIIFVAFIGLSILIESVFRITIPRLVYPPLVASITKGLFVKFQGAAVNQHKQAGGEFYKSRGAAVTLVSLIVTAALFLGFIQIVITATHSNLSISEAIGLTQPYDTNAYAQRIAQITQNDQQSIMVFSLPATTPKVQLLSSLDTGITRYKQNLTLINEIDSLNDIPAVIKKDDARLRNYTELRIQMFELIKKAIAEDSKAYDSQINDIGQQIEALTQPASKK